MSGAAEDVLQFLRAVRRRLRAQRLASALRGAALVSLALVIVLIALHFGLRAVGGLPLLLALALPALAAAAMSLRRRPDLAAAALHADRALGGLSGFSTCLEFLIEGRGTSSPAARTALEAWSRAAVAPARQRLLRQPVRGVRETLVAAGSAALMAVAAAALPGREPGPATAGPGVVRSTSVPTPRAAPQHASTVALQHALRQSLVAKEQGPSVSPRQASAGPATRPAPQATAAPGRGSTARPGRSSSGAGEGRNAGTGAGASLAAAGALTRAPSLNDPVLRDIVAREPGAATAPESGREPAGEAASAPEDVEEFERRQVALAQRAAPARSESPVRHLVSNPAAAALLRRWSDSQASP